MKSVHFELWALTKSECHLNTNICVDEDVWGEVYFKVWHNMWWSMDNQLKSFILLDIKKDL
jgi:hypothetical protein